MGRVLFSRMKCKPFVEEPSGSEIWVVIRKLKRYKSPVVDQIPAELFQGRMMVLLSEIHKRINLMWNKECLPRKWKMLSYPFTKRVIKPTVIIFETHFAVNFTQSSIGHSFL
jgi:hypothetical protein